MQSAIWAKSDICAECVWLSQARFKGPKPEAQRANVGGQFLGRGCNPPSPLLGGGRYPRPHQLGFWRSAVSSQAGSRGVTVEEVGLSLFWVLKVTNFCQQCTIHQLF